MNFHWLSMIFDHIMNEFKKVGKFAKILELDVNHALLN